MLGRSKFERIAEPYLALAPSKLNQYFFTLRTTPERLTIRVWLFPWLSWVTIAAMLGVLIAMSLTDGLASQLYASLVCVVIAAASYWIVVHRRRRTTPVQVAPVRG